MIHSLSYLSHLTLSHVVKVARCKRALEGREAPTMLWWSGRRKNIKNFALALFCRQFKEGKNYNQSTSESNKYMKAKSFALSRRLYVFVWSKNFTPIQATPACRKKCFWCEWKIFFFFFLLYTLEKFHAFHILFIFEKLSSLDEGVWAPCGWEKIDRTLEYCWAKKFFPLRERVCWETPFELSHSLSVSLFHFAREHSSSSN